MRIDGDSPGTDDDIASLVSLGDGEAMARASSEAVNSDLYIASSSSSRLCVLAEINAKPSNNSLFDLAQ